jgi:hypothetical protein
MSDILSKSDAEKLRQMRERGSISALRGGANLTPAIDIEFEIADLNVVLVTAKTRGGICWLRQALSDHDSAVFFCGDLIIGRTEFERLSTLAEQDAIRTRIQNYV